MSHETVHMNIIMIYIYFFNVFQMYHRLSPGEALFFNNRRVVHGRTKFKLNGGVRHLQVRHHAMNIHA